MQGFIDYLNDNFGESVEELAKTSEDNSLFDFDFQMINLVKLPRLVEAVDFRNFLEIH